MPRLRVRKDWYLGLADDPISHDHPDAGDKKDAELGFVGAGKARQAAPVQSATEVALPAFSLM